MTKKEINKKIKEEFETIYYNSFRLQGLLPAQRPKKINLTEEEYKKFNKIMIKGWKNFELQLNKIL